MSIPRQMATHLRALAELWEQFEEEQAKPIKRTRARHEPAIPAPTPLDQARGAAALRELDTRRRLRRA